MKYTLEEALKFTKRSVVLLISWPPPINESKIKLIFLDIFFFISFISVQTLLIALINTIYACRDNIEIVIRTACSCSVIIEMSIKMVACRVQRSSFQSIIFEMENIIKQAKPYEKTILEKYVNKCAPLHMYLTYGFYIAGVNFILGPIFLPQSLPTFTIYPFDIEPYPIYAIIYLQHTLACLQTCASSSIDCQVAVLLWFASARFEMLQIEITKNIVDECHLKWCILKHRHIISYAEHVVKIVRFVILTTVGSTTTLVVFSGFLLIFAESMGTKFQFCCLDIVSAIRLFVHSYPAENLIEMSSSIGSAAYNLNWIEKSQKISKNLLLLIQRSQKPIIIKISGFLPMLSLSYYMSFLSSAFSYFTTMRAVFN